MKKILSIVIPTYNMEQLLPLCLDSLVGSAAATALEVVVVNDGSKEGSLAVAQRYAESYPDVVRVIDKQNGNYGSTINAALPTLVGEYVKILDADDTFDTAAIAPFVGYLEQISGADMVVGPFVEIDSRGEHRVDYNLYSRKIYGYGVPYNAERLFEDGHIAYFMMHSVAYRTELLRQMGYRQSEGISYTDQQWCFFPIFNIESVAFTDIALYRYNLMREGQTMDSRVQLKSIGQLTAVVLSMAEYLREHGKGLSAARYNFLAGVVVRRMQTVMRKYLLEMDDRAFEMSEFSVTLEHFKQLAPQSLTVPVNGRLKIDLLSHWEQCGARYPQWKRRCLIAADSAMQRVYKLIFN